MKYDFDKVIDRTGTSCEKHSFMRENGLSEDTLGMWVADMDFETAPEVKAKIEEVAAHGIYGYTGKKEEYYEAVIRWFGERFGWKIRKKWILTTPGVVFALATAVRAYTEEQDAILIQRPVYYPFSRVVEQNGRRLVNSPLLLRDGKYVMDYEDMERKIVEQHVKMFILCSPHNPVSRVWTREELLRAAEICMRHQVLMLVDEIHCDFVLPGHHHTSFATLSEEVAEHAVICTAPSKTFNLAGLQLSNIVIQNPELRKKFVRELNKTSYYGANIFGQMACQAAYEKGADWLEELLLYLKGNVDYIRDYLEEYLPKVHLIEPEGTYLLWMDFRDYGYAPGKLQNMMLHEAGLWLDEGMMFGEEGAGFMRINIASPRSVVREAMERIKRVFGE